MSSYSCVLPIDWQKLWDHLLPAWRKVLSGDRSSAIFFARWAPFGDESVEEACLETADFEKDSGCSTEILCLAIQQSCSVELPGEDAFAAYPDKGYYSRLMNAPGTQVAGTKNRFYFLEGFYNFEWEPQSSVYRALPRSEVSGASLKILENLFLGGRSLPGAWVAPESPSWPAANGAAVQGYLSPEEVSTFLSWSIG